MLILLDTTCTLYALRAYPAAPWLHPGFGAPANCACRCKGSGGAAGEKLVTLAELRDSEMRAAQQDVQNSQQFTMHLAKIEARLQTLEDSSRLANDRLKILQAASARAKHEASHPKKQLLRDRDRDP